MENKTEARQDINVYNLIVLDESGSMESIYSQALTGINETLNSIRANQGEHPEQHHFVTVVTFEGNGPSSVKVRRDRVPVEKVENLTEKDYRPCGCTPLYDAMGISIRALEKNMEEGSCAFVTVITDGYENASREYSGRAVRDLVERMRGRGWTFAYIGANQDAVEVARDLSITNALNFDATPEGTVAMMVRYRAANKRYSDTLAETSIEERCCMSCSDLFDDDSEDDGTVEGKSGGIARDLARKIFKK